MGFHSDVTTGAIHIVYNYSYANDATREAATGFVAADIGKVAIQTNDNTLWLLVATTPIWVPVSGAFLGQLDAYQSQIDGIVATEAEHYHQQSEMNSQFRTSMDGYIISSGASPQADGYIAFYVNNTTIAGDNDLFYDRANSRLGLGTTTPLGELHIAGAHPNLLVQAGTNANATVRLTEDASFKGGFIRFEGGSSPELVAIGRHATSDTDTANDTGVVNIRIDSSAVSIGSGGTTGLGSSTVTINSSDANLGFLETNPEGITSTASLGKVYVGTDQRFYFIDSNGLRRQLIFNSDIDGYNQTIQEHYTQFSEAIDLLRTAADAYGSGGTEAEHYHQQSEINGQILSRLDGYGQNWVDASQQLQDLRDAGDGYGITISEHNQAQQQINQSIIQALDGYAQNWIDTSQQLQDLRDVLDADAYVDSVTFNENKEAQGEINDAILESLDGYAAPPGGVSETTFQENKAAQEQINQSILQALDGYSGGTGPVTAIGDTPDGYAGDFTGGTTNGHGLISRAAGDGYGIIAQATTGYALLIESNVASPDRSPLRIVPQTALPVAPLAGDLTIQGNSTGSSGRRIVAYDGKQWDKYVPQVFASEGSTSRTTTGNFVTNYTIPANTLRPGSVINAVMFGTQDNGAPSGNITCEMYYGGTLYATSVLHAVTTTSRWYAKLEIVNYTIGTSGTGGYTTYSVIGASAAAGTVSTLSSYGSLKDTTADIIIQPACYIQTTATMTLAGFHVTIT